VPKTLLAVDDSATMRKVLEITFAGEDFRVVTADGASAALARMVDEPVAALIDASLGGDDGYALAKEVRSRDGRVAVVMMASRYTPYDANRGRDAGVDDFIDKPFDTQALIDKVKKALVAREVRAAAPAPVAPPVVSHAPQPTLGGLSRGSAPTAPVVQAKPVWPTQRSHTLSFEGTPPGVHGGAPPLTRTAPGAGPPPQQAHAAPPPAAPATHVPRAPVPVAHTAHTVPTAPPRAPEQPPPVAAAMATPHAPAVAAATNGHLAGKLGELGLTPQQVDAVLALSREVVERVVWEVVPQLAETIIKEEIARLTSER